MHTIPKPSGLPTSSIRHGRYRPGRWRLVSMAEGLLGTLLLCASCGTAASDDNPLEGVSTAGFFNTTCPIGGEAVEADGGESTYMDQKIGFCCGKSVSKFDAMSDADKTEALAKVGTKLP